MFFDPLAQNLFGLAHVRRIAIPARNVVLCTSTLPGMGHRVLVLVATTYLDMIEFVTLMLRQKSLTVIIIFVFVAGLVKGSETHLTSGFVLVLAILWEEALLKPSEIIR